jgi:uncharacterized protein (DUF58 family)
MMVTWRAAALVAVGAIVNLAGTALLPGWPDPWLVAAIALGVVAFLSILDAMLAGSPVDVAMSRSGETQTRLGETVTVTLSVTNTGLRTISGDLRDAWVPSAGATPYSHEIMLDPGETAPFPAALTPTRRGERQPVRVTVRSYGPLRLAFRQAAAKRAAGITPSWTVTVLPRFDSRKYLPEKLSRLRIIDGMVVTRGRGQGTEFDALREYVMGDDVRSIDWRSSARRNDVLVRTWRPERDRRVMCVLDTGRTSAARLGTDPATGFAGEPRLDAAMDAAMLLTTLATYADDRVDLLAIDTRVRVAHSSGSKRTAQSRLITALAGLEPSLVETDWERVVGEVLRRERRRALVVLFTALEPGALSQGLLPVLPLLTARHRVVLAAVHDTALAELAARRGGANDVYGAASAERALAERRRMRAALTRSGVEVVDEPVAGFAPAVVDTYLRLKAAGKL